MIVRKSDMSYEEYDSLKVKHGICEAYASVNEKCPDGLIESLINNLLIYEKISSSEIRRQVEEALMSVNKKVARAYITKFEEREEKDKTLKKDSDFIRDYINASNASTGSKYDSNANVENKNIVTLGQELHKGKNIQQNRYIMRNKIKTLFSKKLADQYIKDLESHVLYKHDESGTPGYPYCVAITMYPFLIDGLKKLGGQSTAPTDLKSYCGEFINLVYSVSSQFMGAVATPEFLMYMDYFIRKDYGDDYLDKLNEKVELNRKGRTLEQVIENCFQQVVHSMNMPAGNRGYQTVFWNVGYFDVNYFKGVFGDFRFPDGTAPKWETLSWLQKKFMKWFNQERTKYVLTFPVETMAMLTDGHDVVDKEYADFTAEMWAEGHSFFCYLSDSPDSLSSCCFAPETKVLWKSDKYGIKNTSLFNLYNTKFTDEDKETFRVFHNGNWVKGKPIRTTNTDFYIVKTSNGKEFVMTDNHINVTSDGEKKTSKLTTDDYLMFNTNWLQPDAKYDKSLTYEQGYVIGTYLSCGNLTNDGFFLFENKLHSHILELIFSTASNQMKGDTLYKPTAQGYVEIESSVLKKLVTDWVYEENERKKINLNCLLQSTIFREGIVDGWNNVTKGIGKPYIIDDIETIMTSIGRCSTTVMENGKCVIKNFMEAQDTPKWKCKNNSQYFKIVSIEHIGETPEDKYSYCIECEDKDNPYFTLPCGLITHNCRLRNSLKDTQDDEHNHTQHQFSMGTASVATGSKSVMTINLNRIVQNATRKYLKEVEETDLPQSTQVDINNIKDKEALYQYISKEITKMTERVHKYQKAFNEIIKDFFNANMLDVYRAGFIDMRKQYLTIGVNGLTDAAEFLSIEANLNDNYEEFVNNILETINISNRKDKTRDCMYNTEFVPGENLSNKNYNWDKKDGYYVSPKHIMYSSYFFNPEDKELSVLDKMKLHGTNFVKYLDGGQAAHLNLNEHLSFEQYRNLIKVAAENGCNYWTFNIKNSACQECGYISKDTVDTCPKCGSHDLKYLTRIIGYLKFENSFNEARQVEASMRYYNDNAHLK